MLNVRTNRGSVGFNPGKNCSFLTNHKTINNNAKSVYIISSSAGMTRPRNTVIQEVSTVYSVEMYAIRVNSYKIQVIWLHWMILKTFHIIWIWVSARKSELDMNNLVIQTVDGYVQSDLTINQKKF